MSISRVLNAQIKEVSRNEECNNDGNFAADSGGNAFCQWMRFVDSTRQRDLFDDNLRTDFAAADYRTFVAAGYHTAAGSNGSVAADDGHDH